MLSWRGVLDLRGYMLVPLVLVPVLVQGAPVAAIDAGLILLILALSKDGEVIFGHLSRRLRAIRWMGTPQAAAVLMVMPVKTVTALLGAEDPGALHSVAQHATIGLIVLTLGLGLLPSIFRRFPNTTEAPHGGERLWVVTLDLVVLMLLIALGRDGPVLFGASAMWLQEALPVLHEPWMRGFIAAIPIKTVSTLMLAGSWERRIEIANRAVPLMATLAVLTFGVAAAAELGTLWAYAVGALFGLAMLKTTENYRVFVKGS